MLPQTDASSVVVTQLNMTEQFGHKYSKGNYMALLSGAFVPLILSFITLL